MSNVRLFSRVFAGFAALALMLGCGSSAPPPISVAVTPTTATMAAGVTQTFTATVTNDGATPGVTWTASVGTISSGGVYTAATPVGAATATITATSKSDTTKTATAAVTLTPIAVSVSPTTATVIGGASTTIVATVTGDTTLNAGVNWTATTGSITALGVYTAPAVIGSTTSATVTATSKTDNSKNATATITLTPISVSITTVPATMVAGATQTFAATVSSDGASAGVTWTASVGSFTGAVYTAPTPIPVGTTSATITATSKTDTTKNTTATVTLTPIAVTIPTTPTAIAGAATEAITATVTGDATLSAGVTWSITSGGGALSAVTITSVTYTASLPVTTANAVITATSKTDTTKTTTITIPLTPISVAAISPATVNLGTTTTQAFTGAAVANDSSSSGVTWTISPATGAGTIVAATGAYTAPASVIGSVTTVTVTATSVKDPTKTATAVITLNPIAIAAISPATAPLSGGAAQTFTGATLTYDGSNSGVTWSISPASGAGTIVGTTGVYTAPAVVSGSSPVTVTVTAKSVKDNNATTTATITLTPIGITFTTATTGIVLDSGQTLALAAALTNDGSASGASFATTGAGTVAPASATGNTPATTLTATGSAISSVTVTATSIKDGTKTATTSSIIVNPAITFSPASGALTAGTTNTAYPGATITVNGGTSSKTIVIASGALPTGLAISNAGAITGTVSGAAGTYTFAIKATDSATTPASVTSSSYTIIVTATPLVWTTPASAVTLPTATVGTAITPYTLVASGGTGTLTYTLNTGVLPAGITLNGTTGVLSGTPTAPTVVAGNVLTFKATDSASTPVTLISSNVTIKVNPVTLAVPTPTLPTGYVNTVYNTSGYQFTATGGIAPYTWTMSPANVASGLTLSASGLLSGTPTATYSTTISVTATDSATNQQQTLTITPSLTVSNALTVTTGTTLPNGTAGTAYSQALAASGGSGTGYTWTVTGTNTLTAIGLSLSTGGAITGTPTAGSATFTAQVTDSLTHTASATFTITAYAPLALPAPNPSTLPAATTTASYSGSIVATGGVGPTYTWTINSSALSTGGTQVSIGDGLSVSSNGSTTLTVSGTPTSAQTVSFTASVTDSASHTVSANTYTIVVSTTYNVGGQINLNTSCGTTTPPTITLTLTLGGTTIQTQTTNGSGNFSFTNIAAGTYTVTPSITGPSSVFYPATKSVIVTTSSITNANFAVALGYTVSGTVSYSGIQTVSQAKPIYLSLNGSSCGNSNPGTSLPAAGQYTIHGVSPGTYTLSAFQDNLGYGAQNASNPTSTPPGVTVATANVTGANITLADPATVTLTSAPTLQGVAGLNNGAFAQYKAITTPSGCTGNNNCEEAATSYTMQWSTTSTFTNIAGSKTFPATGNGGANIWFVNKDMTSGCTNCSTLTNGSTYYFRVSATSGGTPTSSYGVFTVSGSPFPVTIGAPAPTGGVAVSGSVTYPGTAAGPMYVGFFNYSSGGGFYGQYIASPASAQAYTIQVPIASTYYFLSIVDNNNNGVIDAGDISDVSDSGSPPTANITSATTSQNLTLTSGNSLVSMNTGHYIQIQTGSSDSYSVNATVRSGVRLPVAVELISATNPDVIVPQDIALCTDCGKHQFQWQDSTLSTVPVANDSYGLKVTYSDGTSDASLPATVSAVLTSAAAATSLAPQTGTSISQTPTFSWTYPTNASNYTYQFALYPPSGSDIWDIPGNNSNTNGFASSVVNIPWITSGNDVTGAANNLPTVTNLSTSTNYGWNIEVLDSNLNFVRTSVNYQP